MKRCAASSTTWNGQTLERKVCFRVWQGFGDPHRRLHVKPPKGMTATARPKPADPTRGLPYPKPTILKPTSKPPHPPTTPHNETLSLSPAHSCLAFPFGMRQAEHRVQAARAAAVRRQGGRMAMDGLRRGEAPAAGSPRRHPNHPHPHTTPLTGSQPADHPHTSTNTRGPPGT